MITDRLVGALVEENALNQYGNAGGFIDVNALVNNSGGNMIGFTADENNQLSIESSVADSDGISAFTFNTENELTAPGDLGNSLLTLKNSDEFRFGVAPDGGIYSGKSIPEQWGGVYNGSFLIAYKDTVVGDSDEFRAAFNLVNSETNAQAIFETFGNLSSLVQAIYVYDGVNNGEIIHNITPTSVQTLYYAGPANTTVVSIHPTAADGITPYVFATLVEHTSGNLFELWTGGVNKFSVDYSGRILSASNPPANAAATGVAGTITWDSNFIYVCVAENTWKRAALSSW